MNEASSPAPSSAGFLARNEFLLRRLHSLSGLIPVGAYMVVHLLTNATTTVVANTLTVANENHLPSSALYDGLIGAPLTTNRSESSIRPLAA